MTDKTSRFIVRPKPVGEIPHHEMARVQKEGDLVPMNYLDDSLLPETDLVVHVSEVKRVPPDFKPYVQPHQHEVSSFYGLVGDLTVEVQLGDEKREVTGPASIFIPPGLKHSIRPLRGKGHMVIILRQGKYE
jgi:mannose-6-phosphate isomerase-like protein (cupin superfamily)